MKHLNCGCSSINSNHQRSSTFSNSHSCVNQLKARGFKLCQEVSDMDARISAPSNNFSHTNTAKFTSQDIFSTVSNSEQTGSDNAPKIIIENNSFEDLPPNEDTQKYSSFIQKLMTNAKIMLGTRCSALHPSTCSEQPTKETDNCQYDSKATIHSNYKLGYVRDYTRYTPSDYCLCDEDDHENVSKLESTWTTADSLPKEQSLANSARSKPTSSINYSMQCQASTSDRLTVDSMPPTTNLKYFYSDNEYNSPHDDIFPKFKEPVYKKGQRKYLKGHKVYINSDDHHYEGPKVFADRPNVFIEEQNLYYDDQSTDINDKTGRDSIETCEKYIDSQYLNEYNHKTTRDVNKGDTPDKDTNDVSKKSESSRRMFSLLDTTWLNPFRREASKKSTLTQNLTNIEDEKKTDSLNNIPCRDVTCFRVTESNRANSAEPIRIRGDNHYTPEHISRGSLGVGSNSNEIKKVKAHSCDLYNDRNHKINSKYVYTHAQSQNIGKTSNQNKSDYNIRNNLVSTGCNVDPLVDKSIKTSLSNCDPNCRVCRHDKVHPNKDPRNKTSFVDTSVGSAAIRTTDMVASERGYERGDESNISTETSPPRFVEESPNSSKHKLLANSNKNDTNKSDSLQETPSNSLSNPMSFTTVNQCNMSGSFVSVTNKKTKNINKNRMEKRKKSSWGNDYNPSPKRVRSNHKQKDQDNQCAFIGSPVLISDVFKENEGTPNNNYSPHEDVYLPNCPTCRPYLRTNSLLTGEPLRIGSPNSYGGDRFIDSNSSRFRNRPTTSYENRLTRSSIEKARYMEERLSNVQDHFPWSPVKVIIDPELERITSELKTENRILKSELLEMRLELKHALEKVEGPMRSKLEAEKFRCEQLQQELHRASHDMELSKDAFIKESHKLKTQLFEATTNMTQLEAINQRLRNEMEVLDGLCAKLEEDLVNQKVNEAETLKRITQRKLTSKKDVYSEEEISAEQLEATYDYLKDTDCIVSELVSENTIHESNLNVLARKLSKTIKDSDPRENCLNIPTELTDAVKMIKDLTDMVEKRKGERISVNTFSVSKNNCSCQSPPSVAVAACQYIGLNDIGIVVSKSLFPSVPPNVNNEKIAISTKTLFGVPQNFVVENISSKNIVENTELPLKPAASFVHQDFPFAGDSPCLKDQCTDPKSADKKISYNPPIYPLAKPLMVDKESNYETRKCAFGDYIKDPKDNVVACYVVNTPICPLKPPTQDKGSPPTMKDQSTFCCNDKNDDNYKCADLEEPPCKGLGIPCDEVEANEDVNNKCEDSEEAPCKSLGIPCCNVKADEEDVTLDTKQDLPLGEKIDFDYSDPDPNYPVNPDIIVDFKTCADTESAPCKDKGIPCVKKGENIPSLTDNAPVTSSAVTKNLTANSQSPCARFGYPCSKNKNDTSGQLPEDINIIQEDNKTDAATEDTVITIDKDIGSGIICPVTAAFEDIGEQKKIAVPCGEDAACASIDRPCTKLADKIETESFAVKTDTAKGGDTEIAKSMDQQEEPGEEQVKGGFLSLKVEVTKDATSEVEKYNFEFEKPKTALITTVIQDGILGVKTEGPTGTIKSTLKYLPGGIVEVQTEITEATGTPDVARPFLPTTKREDSVPKQETVTMPKSSLIKGESDVEICDDITCQNKAITTGPEFEEVVICPKSGKPCKNRITKRPCTSEDQFKPAGTQEPQLREAGVVTDPKAKRQQEVETVPQTTTTSASKQVPIFDKTTSHTTPTKDAVIKTLEIETKETPTSLEDVTVSSPQQTHEIPVSGKSVGDDDTRATIASSTLPIEMTSKGEYTSDLRTDKQIATSSVVEGVTEQETFTYDYIKENVGTSFEKPSQYAKSIAVKPHKADKQESNHATLSQNDCGCQSRLPPIEQSCQCCECKEIGVSTTRYAEYSQVPETMLQEKIFVQTKQDKQPDADDEYHSASDEIITLDGVFRENGSTKDRIVLDAQDIAIKHGMLLRLDKKRVAQDKEIIPRGVVLPDGSRVLSNGNIQRPDGTIITHDGDIQPLTTTFRPFPLNGSTIQTDLSKQTKKHQLPEGYIIEPDGSIQPLGSKLLSDGTILRPDGNIVYPDGTVKSFDGHVLPLKKSIELSQSFMLPDGTIVQEDGTIVGPDGSIYPKGSRLSPGGTILLPDGKSGQKHQLPEGYIIEPGGSIQPLGSKLLSDGTILRPDGNIVYPDGTVKSFDGQVLPLKKSIELSQSFMLPDGTIVQEDGTIVGPDGSIYPTGSRLSPGGTILLPDDKSGQKHQLPEGYIIESGGSIQPLGSKLLSDGTILRPDGNIVYPNGTVKSFDGQVLPLKKSIELNQSFMLPDGTVVQEDGTVVGPDGSIYPTGSRLSPGGTILLPDSKSIKQDETLVDKDKILEKAIVKSEEIIPEQNDIYSYTNQLKTKFKSRESPHEIDIGTQKISQQIEGVLTRSNDLDERSDTNITQKDKPIIVVDKSDNLLDIDIKKDISTPQDGVPENDNTDMQLDKITAKGSVTLEDALTTKISVGVSEITETVTTKNGQHYQIPGLIAKDKENEVLTDREEAATVSELPIQRQITPDSLPISSITPESDIITRKTYSETNADTIKTDEIKSQPRSVPGIPDKDGLDDALKDKEKGASNGLPIKTRATSDSFPTPTITPESVIMKQKKSGSLNRLPIKKRVTSDSLPIRLIARESVTMKQKILSYSETDAATIKTDKVMSQPSEAGTTVNGPYPLSSVIAKDGADEVLKDKEKAATLSDLPIKSKDTPDSLPTVAITPESIIITRKISSISDQDISQLSEELVITNGEYYPPSGIIAKDGADDVLKDSDKAAQISELPIKSQITDDISTPLITAKGAIIREKDIILGTNGSVIKSAIKTSEDLSKPEIMPESAISTEKVKTFTPDGSVIKTEETVLRKFEPSETTPTANEQQYPISSTIDNDELDQILQEKEKSVTASGQQLEGKFISDSLPMPPITAETSAVKSVEKIDEIVLKTFEADVPTVKDDMSKPSDTIKTTETGEKYYSLHALDIGEYQILNDQEKVAEISEPLIKTQVTHENIPISSIVPEDSTITEKTSVIAPSGDIQLEEESVKLITASPAGTFTKTGEIGVYPPHVVRPIDGGVSSSSEQLIRLIDTELGETVLSERVKHLDDVGEAIYVDKPIIEFDSIDKKSQTEKVGNGRDKLSKSDKRHSSEVPDFVSKLSYKDIPPPLEVTDSKRPRKKRSSKTDIKVCTCHSSCTCILCSSEIMEKRASKPPKKESKTKESKTCYCRGTGNKTLTQLSPQHTAYPNNLYQPPLLHPKRKCETFVGGPPCNKPRQQFNLEKGVKQRSKISIDDVFNPSTYKRDVEKPLKKGVFKKRHGADCECVDCLCSPMIRALSTTREFFKVRDTKQIYQVSNIKCFCPNTSKKISKIPVSTNPAVPKVRSTAVVCTCDPCECQPCSDTKKDAAGTVKVDEKGALILPTMDEVMKMTPEQLKALCDCDPCNCEVCYNKPAPPVRDDVTCDLPSGDQVPMCCCRPGCVCEFCQVEEIKKQIKKLEQEIYSLKATTPTIAQDTIAQDTTHPEGCDCELCKCPLAPGKEETAKIAAAQSPQGDQNADCDCTVCLCPEGPNKDKLSSSQPTGHPDDCDCDTCRCPLSPLKDQPKTPGHPVDCDCDLCKCPLAATVGDGKMCNCGDFCLCPGRPTADKKDPMSGCTCKPTCLCPKGPMPTCECPTDECICSPCSDPRKNLMDPTQVLKKSDSDKCTCSVCKCFEEIPKHAHPDDCTCEVCKCDEEKAVIVKASECICPICKCGEGDGFPKFAEGPQHPEGCICDECRCGDEESTHPEGCICDVCKCEPEPEHPKECICDICKCEPDEQPPHPKECICDVCRCGSEEQPPHPEGCICPICICKPEEQPKHSEGCICEICKCEPPEKLIPEECTCPICQCEEKQQKESVCICDDPCKCDEKKEIKLEQITEKQQKECVCEKPCKCDEKEQTKSAPVKSCTCGDVCICDQGDTAVEKIQTATAVTAMKSTGIHQVKCTCVQCKCAEQTEHTRTEGFQGDTMKTSATHALSCDCAECKCAEETEEIKIGDLQRGKCKCGVCNCVDCYYKQDNIPHSKDCHCDFCTCVDCCETTDQTVQHKKDEEKKACKCIECKCDPCLNQIASKEKVTCKCGVCICLDCEGERVSKKDETVVISSLPEGKKDEIATVGSLPKNRSCHCIECYCDECNDERKKGSKARPEIKIQTVSPVTKTAATQPPQPRRPAGCTCLSCICIDCVSKKLLDQSGVSTEVKPLTKNTSCHCATCLCPECSAITKSPEIKGTKLENEIQSQAQGQAQIQVPAAIPTEPPQVQIASSVGPPQVQITTSVEPSAPTDPPLFELPQRINCYSKTCTCYLCEKKAVGESRPVSVPASYDTRSEGVAPLFQIPQRMQCSCKNCTCPFDCSLRSQQVAQEIKQDPFGGEKREVVTEFQKPERPLEEQKREVQLPNMQQTQSWPKAQQSMPPYVEHQSREAERTTICFCNNCQCTKCNKDVRPSTAPQSTQAPQSDSSQKVNVPAPIVKSAAIVTVTSWHIQQSRPRSAPGGKSYESCACAMCTCPSDCINSTKTARSDCRCPDCIMEKPSRISAKVGVSQQQSIARASAMCACLSSRVSSAAKSAPSSDCRCPDCIMEKQSRISAKVGETIYDTSVGKISKQRSKGRAKVTSSSKYTTCACASCPDTSVKEEEIHQVASRSQDRKDVRCVCHNCSVCPKARNVDLATIDNETLLKSIESSTKEHCECKEQIKEIRSVLRSIKKSCFVAEKQAMTKPLVKQASDFKQTMSGLKLALINLQEKCKAKDKMIKLMTGELKSRTSSQTLWKVLNTCTEDAPDYDKADDVKDKIPFHTLYPVGEEKSTFDEKVARATERERGQKSTKSCKCGKIPTKQEDRSVNLIGFEVVDIKRIMEDSIIIKWEPPKSNLVTGYDIFINGLHKSKIMSGGRTSAMINSIDLSITNQVTIYALTKRGRCEPPAIAIYEVRSRK